MRLELNVLLSDVDADEREEDSEDSRLSLSGSSRRNLLSIGDWWRTHHTRRSQPPVTGQQRLLAPSLACYQVVAAYVLVLVLVRSERSLVSTINDSDLQAARTLEEEKLLASEHY